MGRKWIQIRSSTKVRIFTSFNSLRPRQNGRLFADDTFKRIFLNETIRIWTKNSLKFVPKGLINNIPALVLIMAWHRPGDKPLSEPMLVRSLTHICVTRPQWVDSLAPGKFERKFRHVISKQILVIDGWGICCEIALIWMSLDFTYYQSTLVQAMAWCRQATSHYLSQCWPRSLSPSGIVTRPQWVKSFWPDDRAVLVNTLKPRQMDAISQTTFSNAFSWMKMFEFRLEFHRSLFPRVQLTIFQQWFR